MFLVSRAKSQAPEILVAFLVFSLSTGVVGGVLLYLDSVGPEVLNEMSVDMPIGMQIHFRPEFYQQNVTTYSVIEERVAAQEQAESVEGVSIIEIYDEEVEDSKYSRNVIMGVESSFFETFSDIVYTPSGTAILNESICYIQRNLLFELGLNIGSNYTISVPTIDENKNPIRINSTLTVAGVFESNLFQRRISYDQPSFSSLFVITARPTLQTYFGELDHAGTNSLLDRIWVNFDTNKLTLNDPTSMLSSLRQIERQLEQDILPYASVVEYDLISVAYQYSTWATSMRIITMAFAVPSVIMGLMLIQYNSNLLADERRRNVGALKTRGATGRQTMYWVLSMSIFNGIVGSFGAILTGAAAAFMAGGVRELMTFNLSQILSFAINLKLETIAILFSFSFILGLIVSLPGTINAFLMSPADAHSVIERKELTPKGSLGNPVIYALMLSISGVLLIPLLGAMESLGSFTLGSTFLGLTVILLLAIFILGFVLLLAQPAASLKSRILLRINKQSLVVGTRVVGNSSRMFRRSEAMAIMFISLVFAAGIFSSLAAATGSNHMKELFLFETGADIVIDVKPGLTNLTLDFIPAIESIDGVSKASGMIKTSAYVTFYSDWYGYYLFWNRSIELYGVQPSEWLESAFILPYFTYYHDTASSILELEDEETNVITNFQPLLGYEIDSLGQQVVSYSDYISLELVGPTEKHYLNCTIVDIMSNNPRGFEPIGFSRSEYIGASYIPGEEGNHPFIMLNIENVHNYLNVSYVTRFYVDLNEGVNYTRVIDELTALAPGSFESVDSPYFGIDAIRDSRAGQTIHGAYTLNVLFSILYLTAGVTLVTTIKIRTMSKHFSLLRALGTDARSIISSVLIDSSLSVILGGIIGGLTGIVLTFLTFQMPLNYLGLSNEVTWDYLPLVLSIPVPLLIALTTIAIVSSLLISLVIIRRKLETNIADDIQHSE